MDACTTTTDADYEADADLTADLLDERIRCSSCLERSYEDQMLPVPCEVCGGRMHEVCSVESARGYRICTGIECLASDRERCAKDEEEGA